MTTANEEFEDLMPHRIKVHGKTVKYDDNGKPIRDGASDREYRCLFDDAVNTVRDVDGTTISVTATAYVAPVPIGYSDVVDIESDEVVEIITPRPQTRQVVLIERHYDSDMGRGMLHNIVLRFQ